MKNTRPGHFAPLVVAGLLLASPAAAQGWQDAPADAPPATEQPAAPTEASAPAATEAAPAAVSPPAAAEAGEPPKIDVTGPEPEPPVARSYHVHDGFYLRLSLGVGAYSVRYEDDFSAGGGALALDLLVGGSPSRGLAIGGGLMADHARNVDVERDGTKVGQATVETGLIGVFIDGFPDPKGGFHLGGLLGLANIRTDADGNEEVRNDPGFGGAAWVGYDAWVGDEWSLGGLLRFSAAVGNSEKDGKDRDSQSGAVTLLFTALYH